MKINRYIKNNINKILIAFIIIQPILDLFVSLSINVFHTTFNIGIIVRCLFLLFIGYVAVVIYHKKKCLIYVFLCIIYGLFYILSLDKITLFYNIHSLVRVFYFPLLLLFMYSIKKNININPAILVKTLFIYIILIILAVITNTGFQSYDIAKKGSLGWFNSTNEISGVISILIPFMFSMFKDMKNNIIKIILFLMFLFVIGEVGTKTPILALIITFITLIIYMIIKLVRNKKYKLLSIVSCIIIIIGVLFVILIPKTNFYKNIKIHMNYLKIDSIKEVFKNYNLFDHFIFSQRLSFMSNTDSVYTNSSIKNKLFGIGYVDRKYNEVYKTIEMDYYDIFYSHGIIGFILYFAIYFYILYKILRNLPYNINFKNLMSYLSLILILILSLFSGHIITSPSVSIYVCFILLNLLNIKKCKNVG